MLRIPATLFVNYLTTVKEEIVQHMHKRPFFDFDGARLFF